MLRVVNLLTLFALTAVSLAGEFATPAPSVPPTVGEVRLWEGVSSSIRKRYSLMKVYRPERANGTAVIVCPGGSYAWLGMNVEGDNVARWLNSNGITAFVLRYRTGMRGNRYPAAIEDLQQAMKLVRNNADGYGIDPERVGTMGFSAGGHLVGLLAKRCENGAVDRRLRPSFTAMIYPVVTMAYPYVHLRSRRFLLGDYPDKSLVDSLSLERDVHGSMAPQFVVFCDDDPTVNPANSIGYCDSLTAHRADFELHRYAVSGHGFGISTEGGHNDWAERFLEWIDRKGLIAGQ